MTAAAPAPTVRPPFGVDHIRPVCPSIVLPTGIDEADLRWGWRLCKPDLTSRNHYRWPFPGNWAACRNPIPAHKGECPSQPGDGICAAHTIAGAQSGGAGFASHVGLLVAWTGDDVLGESESKVRLVRAWVADMFDPIKALLASGAYLRGANLGGAYLGGVDLRGAYLGGADLRGAYLRGAYLRGVDLRGADLRGVDLGGVDLGGARYDQLTLWPVGFDPATAGALTVGVGS